MINTLRDCFKMKNYTVIDLFAGAGGMSYGFEQAGFRVKAAIEVDDWASQTYENNNHSDEMFCEDIAGIPNSVFERFKGVDAVIGGPPCQGFSISASNRRDPNDKRNILYREFLRVVEVVSPSLVLLENVKEIATRNNEFGNTILSEIVNKLTTQGYHVSHDVINVKDFGVPQDRKRFFLLASKYSKPLFPEKCKNELTIWDAISDLPEVFPRKHKEGDIFNYTVQPKNSFQEKMRLRSDLISNHIPMRHTDRIIERFSKIGLNNNVESLSAQDQPRKRGNSDVISGKTYSQNHRRLDPEKSSKTITASFYSSFIHPEQNRNLTVREAARIQSFPDSFKFFGLRTRLSHKLLEKKGLHHEMHLDQFNQVGNAVPPLMAEKLARSLLATCNMREDK